jgi:hypothetical protein
MVEPFKQKIACGKPIDQKKAPAPKIIKGSPNKIASLIK